MLPRNERLGTTAFERAFSQSRTFHHPLLQMRVHYNSQSHQSAQNCTDMVSRTRAAFVVAKKLGRATVRNRMRRRVREAYRLSERRHVLAARGLDIIFMVKSEAFVAKPEELRTAVDELLGRLAGDGNRGNGNRGEKEKS